MSNEGIWKKLFEVFKGDKKFALLMVDSTYKKTHRQLSNSRSQNQATSKTKRGSIRKHIMAAFT